MSADHALFDRVRLRQAKQRAAPTYGMYDFLLREMAARLADRLLDVKRFFPLAIDLGAHSGLLAEYIPEQAGIERLIHQESCEQLIGECSGLRVVADEECLPFANESADLVMSVGALHSVNDVPGALAQIRRILKPGGLFLANFAGGETLKELRASFEIAEMEITGGISPRVSPFIDVRDAGALLQRAGFALPVADCETLTVSYEHGLRLMADLRGIGETNALHARRREFTRREVLYGALDYYQGHFTEEGRLVATVDLITLTGWKPEAGEP